MRNRKPRSIFPAFIPLCVLAGLAGCASKGDAPYAEAVSALEKHGIAVRQAFTNEAPEKSHESLHQLGEILDKFPSMVDGTKLSPADREAAKAASTELFDAYTELDLSLHGGEAVKYEDLEEKIDTNLAVLKDKVAAAGDSGEHIVDHHGDHGHEHAGDTEPAHDHEHGDEHAHDGEHADHDHDGDGVQDHAAEDHHEAADHDHAAEQSDHEHAEGEEHRAEATSETPN